VQEQNSHMSGKTGSLLKQQLSTICYLIAIVCATFGWLAALGWASIALARWAFF
jgi:hypothetical protein